jgi:hypothetical protein
MPPPAKCNRSDAPNGGVRSKHQVPPQAGNAPHVQQVERGQERKRKCGYEPSGDRFGQTCGRTAVEPSHPCSERVEDKHDRDDELKTAHPDEQAALAHPCPQWHRVFAHGRFFARLK